MSEQSIECAVSFSLEKLPNLRPALLLPTSNQDCNLSAYVICLELAM